jgi:stage II sporulation protein D
MVKTAKDAPMKKTKWGNGLFLLAVSLFMLCHWGYGARASSPLIRVRILHNKSRVEVGATGSCRIQSLELAKEQSFSSSHSPIIIEASQQGIQASGKIWGRKVLIRPEEGNSLIRVNWRRYRGEIIVQQRNSSLEVINELPLEKYLWGVIKAEISPKWPLASVLAFTIAARTYAFRRMQDPSAKATGYHISSEQDDQVYRGVEGEDSLSRERVNQTRGKILTYLGEVIEAKYHACCGGYTASFRDVWGGEGYPYLVAKPDGFCKESPYFSWNFPIEAEELRNLLVKKKGVILRRLYWIRPVEPLEGGRVKTLAIGYQGMKKPYEIGGREFREIVGVNDLRSTLFTVKRVGPAFLFKGNGWGHGVGLCQEGAKVMGEQGYTYKEILEFYYPGTTVENVY